MAGPHDPPLQCEIPNAGQSLKVLVPAQLSKGLCLLSKIRPGPLRLLGRPLVVASHIFVFELSLAPLEEEGERGWAEEKEKGDSNTLPTDMYQGTASAIYLMLGISQITGMIISGCLKNTSWNEQNNFSLPA